VAFVEIGETSKPDAKSVWVSVTGGQCLNLQEYRDDMLLE